MFVPLFVRIIFGLLVGLLVGRLFGLFAFQWYIPLLDEREARDAREWRKTEAFFFFTFFPLFFPFFFGRVVFMLEIGLVGPVGCLRERLLSLCLREGVFKERTITRALDWEFWEEGTNAPKLRLSLFNRCGAPR